MTKKKKKTRRHLLLAALGFFVVAVALVSLAIVVHLSRSNVMVVSKAGVTFSVDKVEYDTQGSGAFVAPTGMKFVIVHATLNNNGKTTFNFAPVTQTQLIDLQNNRYDMSPATLTDPIAAGPVAAGGTRMGSISFLVPVAAKGLSISFNP